MMRQPPVATPTPANAATLRITQSGTSVAVTPVYVAIAIVSTPMGFCASLRPWLKAM
jgi:hypothetical protein